MGQRRLLAIRQATTKTKLGHTMTAQEILKGLIAYGNELLANDRELEALAILEYLERVRANLNAGL